ncbi:basic membrane protein-domain-containing protein, partial [Blastocladiella britannica]
MQLWIITIMLAALSGCTLISAISVRIVSGSTTNTLSIASNSACTTLASQNATISCHFTLLDESAPSTQMLADWDAMLLSTNDDLVIAMSFLYATTVTTLAPKYPGRTFAIYDTGVFPPIANVLGLTFAEDQSGFLAGALAAMFTTSKKVGVLGAFPIPPIKRFANGFMQGALALCPACEVHRVYEPSFASAALGQQGAAELLGKGADVIFGAGGQMGSAGILAAAQQNTYVIGVDVDETQTTFLGQVSGPYLLASAIKNTGVSITAAIRAVQGGARGGYNALLDSSLSTLFFLSF